MTSDSANKGQALDELLDQLPGMVYRGLDDPDWTMLFVSSSCKQLTGYLPEQIVNKQGITFERIIHPDDRTRLHEETEEGLNQYGEYTADYRIVTAEGNVKYVSERCRIIGQRDDQFDVLQGYIIDVTEEHNLREEVVQLARMESLGQLTGGIAHDFNNLLTVIIGNLQLLEMRVGGADDSSEILSDALESAWRGTELCRRLLAFGKRQMLVPEPIDINSLMTETEQLLRRTLQGGVEIEMALENGLPVIVADTAQLENAILNLAINARDAMPDGGVLTIRTSLFHANHDYVEMHPDASVGDYVMVDVSDTGVGMSSALVDRVFEPFFSTKEVGKGSGLGLSMVYGLLKQSDGFVRVDSEPGYGTSVKLFLPVSESIEDQNDKTGNLYAPDLVPGGTERIMVVEDDDAVRKIAVRTLSDLGYQVIQSSSGVAALELLKDADTQVDLLFTDVVMPGGIDGASLATEATHRRPELKVLLTSGFSRKHVDDCSEFTLLHKPYSKGQIARTIRQILDS